MAEQDRLEFIREVLRSAPAGQFNDLLENIQKLSTAPLQPDLLQDFQQQYESQTCAGTSSDGELSHTLAAPLKEQVESYQRENGPDGITSRRALAPGADGNQLLLRTYSERVDEAKCRTGSWTAEWTIGSEPGSSSAELSGQVSMCVFSYEDGNIQIRSTRDFAPVVVETPGSDLAQEIVKQIGSWEEEFLSSLKDSYSKVGQNLRSIRGILPITHARLNWNVVAQRTVRTLQETVNK
jgi:hypothetical protein